MIHEIPTNREFKRLVGIFDLISKSNYVKNDDESAGDSIGT